MGVTPDICVLQNVSFTAAEMQDVAAVVGRDLFTVELRETLGQFEQAKNFGSLIVLKLRDPAEALRVVAARDFAGDLLLKDVQERVVAVLRMAEALSPKYHVVVANPPYMGGKGMNAVMSSWVKLNYPASKSDLMTCFMERAIELLLPCGSWGVLNLPSWMSLSSFELIRLRLVETQSIGSLIHFGRGVFGSDFGTVALVAHNKPPQGKTTGVYRRLFERHVQVRTPEQIRERFLQKDFGHFRLPQIDLIKIPGNPISYWLSPKMRAAFRSFVSVNDVAKPRPGQSLLA